jgi:polyhydroxyalkanoate synthesis regulator phasin
MGWQYNFLMSKTNQTKKEITNEDLAKMMTEGFGKAEKQTDKKIEALALMVARGFNDMNDKMDKGFKETKTELREEIKNSEENVKAEINKKVDKIEYNTLEYRVEKMEKKFA